MTTHYRHENGDNWRLRCVAGQITTEGYIGSGQPPWGLLVLRPTKQPMEPRIEDNEAVGKLLMSHWVHVPTQLQELSVRMFGIRACWDPQEAQDKVTHL